MRRFRSDESDKNEKEETYRILWSYSRNAIFTSEVKEKEKKVAANKWTGKRCSLIGRQTIKTNVFSSALYHAAHTHGIAGDGRKTGICIKARAIE